MSQQYKKFLITKSLLLLDNWADQYWDEIRTFLNTPESLADVEETIPLLFNKIAQYNASLNSKDTLLDAVQEELNLSENDYEITMLQEILDKHLGEENASESDFSQESGRTIH